jgi:hypothetical protein
MTLVNPDLWKYSLGQQVLCLIDMTLDQRAVTCTYTSPRTHSRSISSEVP